MIARPTSGNGSAPKPGSIRCAIYTRQSVFDDREGEFGSLAAQAEAATHHIAARRGEGWQPIGDVYEDAGYSGATTARPALLKLMADIKAGMIDRVVVYKIDRFSRSLRDFARLHDMLEQHQVGFVSVTQSFDTSTSMGRLILNVLMSFAEFERSNTAERVTDKIAASRKRGLWTGGRPPLGLDSVDGKLVVNTPEAEAVRAIVAAYLETVSLTSTLERLRERGIVAKGGAPFTVATLRTLLHSPLIGGRINAPDGVVQAQHEAILDEPTWEALQAKLAVPEAPARRHRRVKSEALLANLVRCGKCGATWSAHWTGKANGRRYGAYTCQSIIQKGASACPGSRVPAHALETFVIEKVRVVGRDPEVLREAVAAAGSELEAQRRELTARVTGLKADARRRHDKKASLVDAVSQGGGVVPELAERLSALRLEVEAAEATLAQAKAELARCKRQTIDEGELRAATASFDGVWQRLFPAERQRILRLLIERIVVTASPDGEDVAITYSAEGARRLLAETSQGAP